jgi:hypothetical protein
MNSNLFKIIISGTLTLVTTQIPAQVSTLEISAVIDGRDQLIIQGNTLLWHHFDFAAVGRHEFLNAPTTITTTRNGVMQMDHFNWTPDWPALPPDEIRFEAFSSTFTLLNPAAPQSDAEVSLEIIQARSGLSLIQTPTLGNSYTTILQFDDNAPSGHDTYVARLTFSSVPEPAVGSLVLLGLLLARGVRLRQA